MTQTHPILELDNLVKCFPVRSGAFWGRKYLYAINGISLEIQAGDPPGSAALHRLIDSCTALGLAVRGGAVARCRCPTHRACRRQR